jgi:dihydropteroate synthase
MIFHFGSIKYDLSSRTHIMGILNVTPDSFSDGGKFQNVDQAVRYAMKMVEDGADIIDVGGESTRPGSEPVPLDEELRRVIPVIERLVKLTNIPISVDTYKSEVAERALNSGAVIVNDISGLQFDKSMSKTVAQLKASIILMHIKGTPRTMQIAPEYKNLIEDVCSYLETSIRIAKENKIEQIIVDPGIGFGKTLQHNLEILRRLNEFKRFGFPILIGPSRKSFIGKILDLPVDQRLEGTIAAVVVGVMNGANIVRVHDVREVKRAVQVIDAIMRS